jgi:hypothetical protein
LRRRDRARTRRRPQDRHGSRFLIAASAAVVALAAGVAALDAPPDAFLVNEYATGTQIQPAVHALSDGGFVATWTSAFQDGFGLGVFGRVFDSRSAAVGSEFQVNSFTTCYQFGSTIMALDQGFVVAWQSGPSFAPCSQDGSGFGVFARVFDGAGAALTGDLQVNEFTAYGQANPAVARAGDGFVVVWDSAVQDGDGLGVVGRRFAADGSPAGTEFRVSVETAGDQYRPAVETLDDGGFTVVWLESRSAYAADVLGRQFDSAGVAAASEVRISEAPRERRRPLIVGDDGVHVALWSARSEQGPFDVFGATLGADGAPVSQTFALNTFTTGRQLLTAAAAGVSDFVVVWNSLGQDGDSDGVIGRRVGLDGRPNGPEFLVNAYSTGEQSDAAVAALDDGRFVVAWSSPQDASEYAIVAAVFDGAHALAECGDADSGGSVTARDGLLALLAATGAVGCPLRTCDVDADGMVTATDALRILRRALGAAEVLECRPG